jgi:hypothetical protein
MEGIVGGIDTGRKHQLYDMKEKLIVQCTVGS